MTHLHNVSEIMRRTGLAREAVFRLRAAGIIEPVYASPLGRPLFAARAYARIERAAQLQALGMTVDEVRQSIELDPAMTGRLAGASPATAHVSNG